MLSSIPYEYMGEMAEESLHRLRNTCDYMQHASHNPCAANPPQLNKGNNCCMRDSNNG